jgi:hypothetical protein
VAGVLAFAAAEAWVRPERCAGALWKSVLIAPIGEASEKPKLLIDRDYGPALPESRCSRGRRSIAAAGGIGATPCRMGSYSRRDPSPLEVAAGLAAPSGGRRFLDE